MTGLVLCATLLSVAPAALAQTPAAPAAPAAASAAKDSSPAKKALVAQVLKLQAPALDGIARVITEQALGPIVQQTGMALQTRVPADKREALAQELQADLKKTSEEMLSLLRGSAAKLAPTTIGPLLEQRLSEPELKQLVVMLESPIYRKYQGLAPEMQRAVLEKLVADNRSVLDPKLRTLHESINRRIGAALPAAAASGPSAQSGTPRPATAAAPASKP